MIKIDFVSFGEWFDKNNNKVLELLKTLDFNLDVTDDPDYVFVGSFKPLQHYDYYKDKISIFFPGEAIFPDFNIFDYAVGFDQFKFGDRYFRYLCLTHTLKRGTKLTSKKIEDRNFCDFIYQNNEAHPNRDLFFHKLSSYKKVDSLGNHLKNVDFDIEPRGGNWFQGGVEAKSNYKFSIAFENSLYRGYTTEKICSSFLAQNIPIYWGNPNISEDINPESFINCHDYDCFERVIDKIKEIDNNDILYDAIVQAPKGKVLTNSFQEEQEINLKKFLSNIFSQNLDMAKRKPSGYWNTRHINSIFEKQKQRSKMAKILRHPKQIFKILSQ